MGGPQTRSLACERVRSPCHFRNTAKPWVLSYRRKTTCVFYARFRGLGGPGIGGNGIVVEQSLPCVVTPLKLLAVVLDAVAHRQNALPHRGVRKGRGPIGGRAEGVQQVRNGGVPGPVGIGAFQMAGEQDHGGIEIMLAGSSFAGGWISFRKS